MELARKECTPCKGGVEPLKQREAEQYLADTPGWELAENATRIRREFKFKDFAAANEFVDKVGVLAEAEGHHPDISFGYGYAAIDIWTHKIGGLHENDFILAAKINELL